MQWLPSGPFGVLLALCDVPARLACAVVCRAWRAAVDGDGCWLAESAGLPAPFGFGPEPPPGCGGGRPAFAHARRCRIKYLTPTPVDGVHIRKGQVVLLQDEPCLVVEVRHSKTGKHGYAKTFVKGEGLLSGQQVQGFFPARGDYPRQRPSLFKMHREVWSVERLDAAGAVLRCDGVYARLAEPPEALAALRAACDTGRCVAVEARVAGQAFQPKAIYVDSALFAGGDGDASWEFPAGGERRRGPGPQTARPAAQQQQQQGAEGPRDLATLRCVEWAEVQRHAAAGDCWVVVDNLVCDVTRFLAAHPGGRALLLAFGGQDASEVFRSTGHGPAAYAQVLRHAVARVPAAVGPLQFPEPSIATRLADVVRSPAFPCVAAKACVLRGTYTLALLPALLPRTECLDALAERFGGYVREQAARPEAGPFHPLVCVFMRSWGVGDHTEHLMEVLARLHQRWFGAPAPAAFGATRTLRFGELGVFIPGLHDLPAGLLRQFDNPIAVFTPTAHIDLLGAEFALIQEINLRRLHEAHRPP